MKIVTPVRITSGLSHSLDLGVVNPDRFPAREQIDGGDLRERLTVLHLRHDELAVVVAWLQRRDAFPMWRRNRLCHLNAAGQAQQLES